jgi:hypothetical protein
VAVFGFRLLRWLLTGRKRAPALPHFGKKLLLGRPGRVGRLFLVDVVLVHWADERYGSGSVRSPEIRENTFGEAIKGARQFAQQSRSLKMLKDAISAITDF